MQLDLFEDSIERQLGGTEKWIARLEKRLWVLKQSYELVQEVKELRKEKEQEQKDIFELKKTCG